MLMSDPYSLRRYLPLTCRLHKTRQRRNLVVVRLKSPSEFERWFNASADRSWDLMLCYYALPMNTELNAEFISIGGLSKFSSIKDLYNDNPSLFLDYDFCMFVDDDIEFQFRDVDLLFKIGASLALDLFQPSLTADSILYWSGLFHDERFGLRYTNFVEVMTPVFSRRALEQCIKTFDKSISSWGLDHAWSHLLTTSHQTLAVVDAIQVRHARLMDTVNGAFYKFLASLGIDPHAENESIWDLYRMRPKDFEVVSTLSVPEVEAALLARSSLQGAMTWA